MKVALPNIRCSRPASAGAPAGGQALSLGGIVPDMLQFVV